MVAPGVSTACTLPRDGTTLPSHRALRPATTSSRWRPLLSTRLAHRARKCHFLDLLQVTY
jgi:hypothetical protein